MKNHFEIFEFHGPEMYIVVLVRNFKLLEEMVKDIVIHFLKNGPEFKINFGQQYRLKSVHTPAGILSLAYARINRNLPFIHSY